MLNHGDRVNITDKNGDEHSAQIERLDGDGWKFKVVCRNSWEELARGEENLAPNADGHYSYIELHSYDPIFEHDTLALQLEAQFNLVDA